MNQQGTERKTAGIILAAGLGTRMRPLTDTVPKPLLPVLGVPIIRIVAEKLLGSGAFELHANIFHLPDMIESFAQRHSWPLKLHREHTLLGTGGGIGNMACDLGEFDCLLLHNGDIVSNLDYDGAVEAHVESGALVTLLLVPGPVTPDALRAGQSGAASRTGGDAPSSRAGPSGATPGAVGGGAASRTVRRVPPGNIAVAPGGAVVDIGHHIPGHGDDFKAYGYTGLAVLSPGALDFFPEARKAGLIGILLGMMEQNPGCVRGFDAASTGAPPIWGDTGSPGHYLDVHRRILAERETFDRMIQPPPLPIHAGEASRIEPGVRWEGFLEIGARARIGRGSHLEECVVLPETEIGAESVYRRAIIYPGGVLEAEGEG